MKPWRMRSRFACSSNIYDRLADSLSFHLPGPDGYAASGRNLMKRGYLL